MSKKPWAGTNYQYVCYWSEKEQAWMTVSVFGYWFENEKVAEDVLDREYLVGSPTYLTKDLPNPAREVAKGRWVETAPTKFHFQK